MNYTNVKQLLNNLDDATKELPVRVTKFGKPIFEIWPVDSKGPTPSQSSGEKSEKISEEISPQAAKTFVSVPQWAEELVKICEAPNQKCRLAATKRVFFEDPDHVEHNLLFCDEHLKALKRTAVEIFKEEDL